MNKLINKFTTVKSINVQARTSIGFKVNRGQLFRIIDVSGSQPADFWAFNSLDVFEHLSCEHTRPSIQRLYPREGNSAFTNHRRPIVTLLEDNSPGEHDMEFAACDKYRYLELGADESHANCTDNLHKALSELGLSLPYTPQPWNLFTNFFLNSDGTFEVRAPSTKSGDSVTMRSEMDSYVIVSACPQDMNDTCGGNPTDILVEIGVSHT